MQAVLKSTTAFLGLTSLSFDRTSLSAVSLNCDTIDVFAVQKGRNGLEQKSWNGTDWSTFIHPSLPDDVLISSAPTVAIRDPGTLDLFVTNDDNILYNRRWNGSVWTPTDKWTRVAHSISGPVTAVSSKTSQIDVFAVWAQGNKLVHLYQNDDNEDGYWVHPLDQECISTPGAVVGKNGRIDLLTLGKDHIVQHRYLDEDRAWSDPIHLGTEYAFASPTVVSRVDGRLDLFIAGENGLTHNIYMDGTWSGWQWLYGFLFGKIAAVVVQGKKNIDVYARQHDSTFWHRETKTGDDWAVDWDSHGGKFSSAPALVSSCDGFVDVFGIDIKNKIRHARWNGTARTWEPAYRYWDRLEGSFEVFDS